MKNKLLFPLLFFILVINFISCVSSYKNNNSKINYNKDSTQREFKYCLQESIENYLHSFYLKDNFPNIFFNYHHTDYNISNLNLLVQIDSGIVLKTYNFNIKKISYYKINKNTYNDIKKSIKCLETCENYHESTPWTDDYFDSFEYCLKYNKNKYLIILNYSKHPKDNECHDLAIKTLKAIVSEPIICPDLIYKTTNFEDELPDSVLYEDVTPLVAPIKK